MTGRAPSLLHPGFVAAGAFLFIAALATDWMSLWQWANFSAWLITGGLLLALFAGIFLVVDIAIGRAGRVRSLSSWRSPRWPAEKER